MARMDIGDFVDNYCAEEQDCAIFDENGEPVFEGEANEIPEELREKEIDVIGSVADDSYTLGIWVKKI